jgi:transcriptional regulator with XRE-family HTH domain
MLNANKLTNDKNGIVKKQDVLDWYKNLNIVKRACKELGITQKELADKLGVSKPSVERWAQGETPDQAINHIHLLLENIALSKELDELKSALKTIAKYSILS